jgi:hypothetical protein
MKKIKKKMKLKANILEIPSGIVGFIVVSTLSNNPGQLNTIANLFTWKEDISGTPINNWVRKAR